MKIFFTFLILNAFIFTLKAQNYLNESCEWVESYVDDHNINCSVTKYRIDGDTIINGLNYYKLIGSHDHIRLLSNGDTISFYKDRQSINFIREEEGIFYELFNQKDREIISFNLRMNQIYRSEFCDHKIVDVDTTYINGAERKVFKTDTGIDIIEGVGTSLGLLTDLSSVGLSLSKLHCFSINQNSYEFSDKTSWPILGIELPECVGSNTTKVNDENSIGVKIYPNPADDYFIIETDSEVINSQITILDLSGSVLHFAKLNKFVNKIYFDNKLSSGVYIVEIKNRLNRKISKIVVK